MKTKIQSLFLALLLVFAAIPAFALTDEESDRQQTEQIAIEASKGKEPLTFWLYPGDQKKLESNMYLTYIGPSQKPNQMACTEELKLCSDGKTYVGRDSNNGCAFNACPGEPAVSVEPAILVPNQVILVPGEPNQGVCEQFSMTFSTPAVLKPRIVDGLKIDARYDEDYKKLEAAFRADFERAVTAGDEEAILKVKKAFEEQSQALSKKYSKTSSDDVVAYGYPEQEDSYEAGYTYPYDFEDFPEDKEVTKLKKEFERKYAEAAAEGEEEKIAKLKEDYLRKFDKIVTKQYDADASRQPIISKPGKPGMTAPTRSETKTFCILPGEVGYPIMLYEKRNNGVLVGYNAWKGENPSSYAARGAGVNALQQTKPFKDKDEDSCQVEGNGAIPVGTRLNVEGKSQYCDALTKKMMVQKQDGEQAENDYECLSNEQNNGQCVNSLNILQKIWKGITGIFGF